ncbi:Aldo/keto reductase [Gymnopus androsaceus JB14]|uniref:Aldo/keto reductase n=1 Tax=Gymnopus androsaceus JB14 TaxID=1447944 RepID=A0A6A4HIV6_9AGAR|nr:Aldo/keto reductase [Gymnopus androsaceus JB14]
MSSIVLKRTHQKMPVVGFGLWKVTKSSCAETVYSAIKAGYRLFDGAGDYGNEKEAGEGVRRALKEGIVKREELFITSKLWNTFHAKEHVNKIAKMQLGLWGLEYFDLFLIHFPIALQYIDPEVKYPPEWFSVDGKSVNLEKTPMQETWTCMEELVDQGLAKNIVTAKALSSADMFRYARIEPQVLQVEIHPYNTQEPLLKLAKTLGIAVTAYSFLWSPELYRTGLGKTPAQVLLRWATQQGMAVIPKSNSDERLVQNLQCEDFELSESEMKAISGLNMHLRLNDPADIDPRMAIFA